MTDDTLLDRYDLAAGRRARLLDVRATAKNKAIERTRVLAYAIDKHEDSVQRQLDWLCTAVHDYLEVAEDFAEADAELKAASEAIRRDNDPDDSEEER